LNVDIFEERKAAKRLHIGMKNVSGAHFKKLFHYNLKLDACREKQFLF